MTEKDKEAAAAYVEQYNHEEEIMKERAIEFAKWLAENDWMSTYVVDKWMWENVNDLYPPNHKHHGMYYTEEKLYELYLKSE